jgi:hypothetical protein
MPTPKVNSWLGRRIFTVNMDPVIFQRFLDAADYWFGCSECFVVVIDDQADGTSAAGAGDREAPQNPGAAYPGTRGQAHLPPHRREALTSMRSWLKRASSRLSSQRSTVWYDCFAPPSLERPPHEANACAGWVGKPVNASTRTSTSTTRRHPRERVRNSLQP